MEPPTPSGSSAMDPDPELVNFMSDRAKPIMLTPSYMPLWLDWQYDMAVTTGPGRGATLLGSNL